MCGGPALSIARPLLAGPELCRRLARALAALGCEARAPVEPSSEGPAFLATLLQELRERIEAALPHVPTDEAPEEVVHAPPKDLAMFAEEVARAARQAALAAGASTHFRHHGAEEDEVCGSAREGVAKEDWQCFFYAALTADLPSGLLARLGELPFEARKDTMRLFAALLRCGTTEPGARDAVVRYVRTRPAIMRQLLQGCGCPEAALICGQMLHSCTRYEELVESLFEAGAALELVALTQHASFDVVAEAFASLRELLLVQTEVAAHSIEQHYVEFFTAFNSMLQAEDYVARRQGLRLLGDMLLSAEYVNVMLRYIGNDRNLRLQMNLLLDPSPMVQLGAFHVLKIFVANPEKPPRVEQILQRNSNRLCRRLEPLPSLRGEDEHLLEDVRAVVEILQAMPSDKNDRPATPSSGSASPFSGGSSSGMSTPAAVEEPLLCMLAGLPRGEQAMQAQAVRAG